MNAQLTDTFSVAKVEAALKEMALLKAPGLDGMPLLFYQSYWSLVSSDVIEAILHYLNTGSLPQSLCHSFITLIPKVKNPELISQYRPICLSNMLFRVFLKVLANRLKYVFPGLISKHQPAFLTIPICRFEQDDTLIWPHTPNGEHTVKSENNFLQTEA